MRPFDFAPWPAVSLVQRLREVSAPLLWTLVVTRAAAGDAPEWDSLSAAYRDEERTRFRCGGKIRHEDVYNAVTAARLGKILRMDSRA